MIATYLVNALVLVLEAYLWTLGVVALLGLMGLLRK